jgi:hypothetical protein
VASDFPILVYDSGCEMRIVTARVGRVLKILVNSEKVVCDLRSALRISANNFTIFQACFGCQGFEQMLNLLVGELTTFESHAEDFCQTVISSNPPVELLHVYLRPHSESEPPLPLTTMHTRVAASFMSLSVPALNRFSVLLSMICHSEPR